MELRWLVVFWHLVIAKGWWCQASHGSCVGQRHKFQDETFATKVIPLLPAGRVKPYQNQTVFGSLCCFVMLCCFSMRLVEIHEMGILTLVDPSVTHHHGATNSLSTCFVQHFSLISIR
jgi:hypothetical protein